MFNRFRRKKTAASRWCPGGGEVIPFTGRRSIQCRTCGQTVGIQWPFFNGSPGSERGTLARVHAHTVEEKTAGFGVTDRPDDWFEAFVDPTIDPDGGIFHWAQSFLDLMSYGPEYDRGVNDLVTDARDAFQKGDLESTRRFLQQAGDRVMAKAGKPREPYNPNFASKKTAADIADPMDVGVIDGAPDPAPAEPPRLYHCPVCGSGSITRGSDGTISCGFCNNNFRIILAPQHPAMPMTVGGEPFTPDGQPPITGEPMDLGNPTPTPGVPAPADPDGPVPGTLQSFRKDAVPADGSATLQDFRTSMLVTAMGDALPFDSFLRHIAIRHADDPAGVIEQVRSERG